MPGLCSDLAVVDASAELLLRVGQQHREGMAVGVFEVDTDRVAALVGEPNVGDDGTGTDLVALVGERSDASVDDIGGCPYLDDFSKLGNEVAAWRRAGADPEFIAREALANRRALGMKYNGLTPEPLRSRIRDRDLAR